MSAQITIQLYLKHFRTEVIDYILGQTGYMNLVQYEMECRATDVFNVRIHPNGYISSVPPVVDEETTAIFELSLHHLRDDVLEKIVRTYLGVDLIEYELSYSTYNNLYVTIPYRMEELWGDDDGIEDGYEYEEEEAEYEESDDEEYEEEAEEDKSEEDESEEDESEEDEDEENEEEDEENEEEDWSYTLNTSTNNSYILKSPTHPTDEVIELTTDDGSVKKCYYSVKYGGWIVSLKCKKALDELVGGKATPVNDIKHTTSVVDRHWALFENKPFLGWYYQMIDDSNKNGFYKLFPKSNNFKVKVGKSGVAWVLYDSGMTPAQWDVEGIPHALAFDLKLGGWKVPLSYASELKRGGATIM